MKAADPYNLRIFILYHPIKGRLTFLVFVALIHLLLSDLQPERPSPAKVSEVKPSHIVGISEYLNVGGSTHTTTANQLTENIMAVDYTIFF